MSLVSKESRKVTHEVGRDPMFRPQHALFGGQNFAILPFGARRQTKENSIGAVRYNLLGSSMSACRQSAPSMKRQPRFLHFQAK